MNRQEFISYIHDPAKLNKASLAEIEELTKEFPYCQSLSILHLLNLRMTNPVLYENQLKSTAAHIADRKRLKELVGSLEEDRGPEIEDRKSKEEKTVASSRKPEEEKQESNIRDLENTEQITDKGLPTSNTADLPIEEEPVVPDIEEDEEQRLLVLKQIVEDRLKEISKRESSTKEETADRKQVLSKAELIDKFIEEEPSISRPKKDFFDPVKVAKNSMEEKDGLVSETLARIHIQQGNIDKAIEIYRKLSLKFPKKSSYFAAQLKKLSTEN